ncbi:MAG: undecaprenyldiphospho-muramoylpentapeptide beta-N-acetylglucosaminyltransferase [Erysipelotrichaceae bacterium]|jgi:UDP-N-acetylglucosamine--N-acetylmuramyl-(pentapeptide) pyrophosphoryl-undecaprenol N-acetylglucosamine transferase|nr:undecaprenyldiphospho-muramoylpentapeptide beta-N-acetylglucosaminyltransferase [Erysipelotrichaceae bacterium]
MKLLIVTGGTGGHIYPALALAEYARSQDTHTDILFVGNDDRMEASEIPAHGFAFQGLHTSGLTGNPLRKIKAISQMGIAYQKAKTILRNYQPDVVIGFGGYVSAPVMLAAHHMRIPTVIHEQNSIVGVANKAVANKVDRIVICYEKCLAVFDKKKTLLLGNPRASVAANAQLNKAYLKQLQLTEKKPLILIVMGSLGSTSVNEMMSDALLHYQEDAQILYVSGKQNYEQMKKKFSNPNIRVVDYVDQLAILPQVDFLICRAGATTLAEITALGKPSILIPSPYVAHNHQYYNASVLVEHKAAMMIEEKNFSAELLLHDMKQLLYNKKLREEMGVHARELGFPDACSDMLRVIQNMKR